MSARFIINADDFGQSGAVNEAVLGAAERGILSSATIMANMPGFEEAARGARSLPKLGVGVHLNILRGSPILDPARIPSLVDRRGKFLDGAGAFWWRCTTGRIDFNHVEMELAAQMARVVEAGIRATHVDSEKHLHILIPRVGEVVCRLAARLNIRAVRIVREPITLLKGVPRPQAAPLLAAMLLNRQGVWLSRQARLHGLAFPDRSFGVALAGRMTPDVYAALFARFKEGTTEIMCHPAVSDNASAGVRSPSWLDRYRPDEYRALIDPATRESLEASGARLINYGEL